MIDIVIPVLNEEKILKEKETYYQGLKQKARIVFVDGGSQDQTIDIARHYGDVIVSPAGRAIQKNRGFLATTASTILFLHVDSYVDDGTIDQIVLDTQNGISAGCLTMKIEDQKLIFRIYERVVNLRAKKLGIVDGDLGLFVKRDVFEKLGHFDKLAVMDDIVFSKRLRNHEKIMMLPNLIHVSSRKWHEKGFSKTFLLYTLAYLQLWTKIPFFKNQTQA